MELSFKDAYVHFRTFSNDEPLNTSIEYMYFIMYYVFLLWIMYFLYRKGTNNRN